MKKGGVLLSLSANKICAKKETNKKKKNNPKADYSKHYPLHQSTKGQTPRDELTNTKLE